MYMRWCVSPYARLFPYNHVFVYTRARIWTYVFPHIRVHVCACVCVCVTVRVHVCFQCVPRMRAYKFVRACLCILYLLYYNYNYNTSLLTINYSTSLEFVIAIVVRTANTKHSSFAITACFLDRRCPWAPSNLIFDVFVFPAVLSNQYQSLSSYYIVPHRVRFNKAQEEEVVSIIKFRHFKKDCGPYELYNRLKYWVNRFRR